MGTNLAVIDKELTARLPMFQQVLPPSVSPQRLMRTVMMSCERTPKLLECTPQSIMNAATTAAVLGLECDGVTGQGFLVPYGNVATFQVGYKGYNTLAARSGYTINGAVVREGDEFDYMLGTGGFVHHKPLLNGTKRRIVATWAVAESHGRPNIVVVMSIEEVEQIKAKSAGARKKDSPWNDLAGPGYAAMVEKTGKRRLARSMPLSVMQQAAALEDVHEAGKAAYLQPDGGMKIVGSGTAAPGPTANGTVSDNQPEDILSPAHGNGDDMSDALPPEPSITFPRFNTPRDFNLYSTEFLQTATADQARAWEDNYRDVLNTLRKNPRNEEPMRRLMALYDAATKEPQAA